MTTLATKPAVGDIVPSITKHPSYVSLFRFSAVMWNAHRTHVDYEWATGVEGHAGLLTQDYLLATYIVEFLQGWAGPRSRVTFLSYRNRGPVHPNQDITVWGKVSEVTETAEGIEVKLEVGIDTAAGDTNVPGKATVLLRD